MLALIVFLETRVQFYGTDSTGIWLELEFQLKNSIMELFLAASGIPWIPLELRDGFFFDSWVLWLKLLEKRKDLPYCLWCLKTSIFSSNASGKWWCVRDYCSLFCHLPSVFEDLEGSQGIVLSLLVYFTSSVIFYFFLERGLYWPYLLFQIIKSRASILKIIENSEHLGTRAQNMV